jgi:4-amino-4-deoxy-L-arabinose transferase-like glycosyltransferase
LWLSVILALVLTIFAFWGYPKVPFHPDESTQLFMSSDFETLFKNPIALAWSPEQAADLRTHYRLVDAPLTRYLHGLARSVSGLPAPLSDWDWAKSWEENQRAGALPDGQLLNTGRMILVLLFPIDLLLIYLIGMRVQGKTCAVVAMLLFGANALVLLHNRRAMAEAALTSGALLAAWSFLDGNRRPWLAGLAAALAFSAKQTAVVLVPVGLLAVSLPAPGTSESPTHASTKQLARRLGQFLAIFAIITLAFNPFLWSHPIQAVQAAWTERQDLLNRQVADFNRLLPKSALDTPAIRLAALIANLYIVPPAFAETGNYLQQTGPSEIAYLAIPGHNLLRGFLGGGILFGLTLGGVIVAGLRLRSVNKDQRRAISIVLLTTFALGCGIFWLIPLPWQRYVMPLVPFVCLWSAFIPGVFLGRKT